MSISRPSKIRSCLLFLALIFTVLPSMSVRATWEITEFEVFAGAPYVRDNGVVDAIGYDWAEAEDFFPNFDRAELEKAFNDAADWYSRNGFPEPRLEPIVQTDSGKKYRVYVCSEPFWGITLHLAEFWQELTSLFVGPQPYVGHWSACGASVDSEASIWAAYSGHCAASIGARPLFFINADGPAFKDGKLTTQGYQTVAHELFHAIQANTIMGKSPDPCKTGKWIGEGQADAVGMYVLDKIWPGLARPDTDPWITKYWGIRPWDDTIADDPSGYPVSAFWRFLGDLNGGFDYLLTSKDGTPGVFDFEIEKAGSWQSEVSWLDAGLLTKFGMRLNELLGLYFNHLVMHIPELSWSEGDAATNQPRWVKGVLGECEEIALSGRKTSHIFTREIDSVAGDCAWLTVNVPQATVQVSLQAEADDVAMFKDVWVGLPEGGTIVSQGMAAGTSPTDASKTIGIWADFTVRSSVPTLFTFTNAANDPDKTKRRVVAFEIAMNSSSNNLRGFAPAGPGRAAPPAQRPTFERHAKTLARKQAATSAMITKQKNLDKEVLSPFTPMSNSVAMRPRQPPCQDPFTYTPCGPTTSINMELMPGTWANLSQSAGSGGAASQVFSSMMGQALSNPMDSNAVMQGLADRLESIDASGVSISLPFIDYGFTGTVDNASIHTEVGGRHMSAFGPPDTTGNTRLTGRVTIEHYSPFRISGSYSASLAYFDDPAGPDQPPVYRRGPTLTGTFTKVAPWLEDSRVAHIQLQSQEEMANDIATSLGIPASTMRSLREDGLIPGGESSGSAGPGDSSAGAIMGGDCDCDCAYKGKVDDLCEFFCEEEFAACP